MISFGSETIFLIMKHTKGEWYFDNIGEVIMVKDQSGLHHPIASVFSNTRKGITPGEFEANGEMLAAAPDLLEACQWALAFGKNGEVHDKMIIEKIQSVIKKAIE